MLLVGIGSSLVGRIAVAGAVLNLALNAALIPFYGIWGAAWSTFGTWALYCAVCWIYATRVHRLPMTPWPLSLILIISAATLWLRNIVLPSGAVTRLGADSAAFALFLAAAILLYLRPAERLEAWQMGRRLARL
jgi:O-antigen/teichoic acid export membrane protein